MALRIFFKNYLRFLFLGTLLNFLVGCSGIVPMPGWKTEALNKETSKKVFFASIPPKKSTTSASIILDIQGNKTTDKSDPFFFTVIIGS